MNEFNSNGTAKSLITMIYAMYRQLYFLNNHAKEGKTQQRIEETEWLVFMMCN